MGSPCGDIELLRLITRRRAAFVYLFIAIAAHALLSGGALSNWIIAEARADSVSYAYDALGRVIQATDSTSGQAVFYAYDGVGNIISQQVVPVTTLAISGLSVDDGAVGNQVTVDGTGFSTTATSNTVTFNGVAGTVTSVTQTELTVTIPQGATAGPIKVTTGSSAATAPGVFTIISNAAPPTISGFSPTMGTAGSVVTISGSNFQPLAVANKVLINGIAAPVVSSSASTLSVEVPPGVGSGHLEILTPYGSATSSGYFVIPPSGYTAANIGGTTAVARNGGYVYVQLSTANQIALGFFDGSAGDQFVRVMAGFSSGVPVQVLDPDGGLVATFEASGFDDLPTLEKSGTYTILVGDGSGTGSVGFAVAQAAVEPLDTTWRQDANSPSGLARGQSVHYTVSGIQGETLMLAFQTQLYAGGVAGPVIALLNSAGTVVWQESITPNTAPTVSLPALPSTGNFSVVVDPGAGAMSNYYFSAGVSVALALNAAPALLAIAPNSLAGFPNGATVGRAYFQGTAGQPITLHVTHDPNYSGSLPQATVRLYQVSTGNYIVYSSPNPPPDYSIQVRALPATDQYYLQIDPNNQSSPLDVQLLSAPTGTIQTDSSLTLTVPNAGQLSTPTFTGTAGGYFGVELSPGTPLTLGNVVVNIVAPDGSLAWPPTGTSSLIDLLNGPYTIVLGGTKSGTYTIYLIPGDSISPLSGSAVYATESADTQEVSAATTITVSTPITGSIAINGSTVPISSSVVGQSARISITGTFDLGINLSVTNSSSCMLGIAFWSASAAGTLSEEQIAQANSNGSGQFFVVYGSSTGSFSLPTSQVSSPYLLEFEAKAGCTLNFSAQVTGH